MNPIQFFFKSFRVVYGKIFGVNRPILPRISDPQTASNLIYQHLMSDEPCMVSRFGGLELATMVNYLGVRQGRPPIGKYIKGEAFDWWWNKKLMHLVNFVAGLFPMNTEIVERFCKLMINDIPFVDVLGSWLDGEHYFREYLKNTSIIELVLLEPFWADSPWTRALEGKKVLVVHPFAQSIEMQYTKRELLFENRDVLPAFDLRTVKPVVSFGGECTGFTDWFEALEHMKAEIDGTDYDICLLGCGAYGFPLAAHIKRTGKKAVHLGGCLQLLFGIRGARWEAPGYNPGYNYVSLMNEHWIRPDEKEKPQLADKIEGGGYW
jgi:hypothetical protein